MAVGAKRFIPRCMGARFLLPGAQCLVPCLRIGICQDQPRNNHAVPKHGLKVETNAKGILEDVELFVFAGPKDSLRPIIKTGDSKVAVYVCPQTVSVRDGDYSVKVTLTHR